MVYAEPLSEDEIADRLSKLAGWERDGESITKTYKLKYLAGLGFITQVVVIEEKMDHHADITYKYGSVMLTISTHVLGKLSSKDFALAEEIERVSGSPGVR
jgi:4a-hydroxytetrahydrobiopterin dehydratase